MHLQSGTSTGVLSVFQREQLFQCFIDMYALSAREFALLRLLHVEPEYRLALGFTFNGLPLDPQARLVLPHLRQRPASSLDELAGATGLDPAWIRRLLNALYLQSGLMITRSYPTPWFNLKTAVAATQSADSSTLARVCCYVGHSPNG